MLYLSDRVFVYVHKALPRFNSQHCGKRQREPGFLIKSTGSGSQVTFKPVLFKVPSHLEFDLPRTHMLNDKEE